MFRKISTIILMVTIILTGTFAFINLHYWERSVRIFSLNSNPSSFRDNGRGRGGFEERGREPGTNSLSRDADVRERQSLPDSLSVNSGEGRNPGTLPDSIQQKIRSGVFRGDRGNFRGQQDFGRRGNDFHGGKRVSLGKVAGFFAVFALFALIAVGVDKGLQWVRIRNKSK